MSHVRVESSVPKHPKFLAAGPAASWLWLCGVAYCQESLTDGFIPDAAVDFLGVARPRRLVAVLVRVALWHVVDGGWTIHDYLEWNNSADYIRKVRNDRKEAGKLGGRQLKKQSVLTNIKQVALRLLNHTETTPENPSFFDQRTTVQKKQERADASVQAVENLDDVIRRHRRRRSHDTDDGEPAQRVIAALARDVLVRHCDEQDDVELRERLKAACAEVNLRYDGASIAAAIDQATAQLRKVS